MHARFIACFAAALVLVGLAKSTDVGSAGDRADSVLRAGLGTSAGELLWTGDLETGDLSQFVAGDWNVVGGSPPRVVTQPVRQGRHAVELSVRGATARDTGICCGTRNELVPRFRDLEEGDDLFFGFSVLLADGFPTSGGWQLITQFKQNFDGAPPLGLYVEDGEFRIEGGYGHPDGPRTTSVSLGPAITGSWVDWVLHVRFSADPAVGAVEVWQDGRLVLPLTHPAGGTLYPGAGAQAGSYVKTGPYRDPAITVPGTLYLDDWRIGTSRGAVAP